MTYRYNPYIVGVPVTGTDFYGRQIILDKIWNQRTPVVHLLGLRRIGKTSVLKQMAATTKTAIYLDLQCVGSWVEFAEVLQDEIAANQSHFPWLPVAEVLGQEMDVFRLLKLLDRRFHEAGDHLWLLLDEAEILIELGQADLTALRKFQSAFRHLKAVQLVFASAKRFTELNELTAQPGYGSPFLNEFPPPIYLGGLDDDDAQALIRQSNEPPALDLSDNLVRAIGQHTNNHPYLIQWVCYHLWEQNTAPTHWRLGDHTFKASPDLQQILKTDFDYLSAPERQVIQAVLTHQPPAEAYHPYIQGLTNLGYLCQTDAGYDIGNDFFKNWLFDLDSQDWHKPGRVSAEATLSLYKK
jgi:hypothetical protein